MNTATDTHDPRPRNAVTRGITMDELTDRVYAASAANEDVLVEDARSLRAKTFRNAEGDIRVGLHFGETAPMTDWASGQLAEFLGIPLSYWNRMTASSPDQRHRSPGRRHSRARAQTRSRGRSIHAVSSSSRRAFHSSTVIPYRRWSSHVPLISR